MTFFQTIRRSYAGSIAFLIACPLLALLPVAVELIQHAVEVRIGMYDSLAAMQALDAHPLRMAFGFAKTLALIVPIYWVTRFLAWRDPVRARRLEAAAVRPFAAYLVFGVVLSAIQLFVLPRTGWGLGVGFLGGHSLTVLTVAWGTAAALGDGAIGPRRSAAIMAPQFLWTFVFLFVAMLPLMIPHYALGFAAVAGPKALMWPALILDSLLVGWLAVVIIANGYFAAVRAADRAGVALAPGVPVGTAPTDRLQRAA